METPKDPDDKETHAIPASSFYKNSKGSFISPALAPGAPRRAALRALERDWRHEWYTFRQQSEAFNYCDNRPGHGLHVWAFEIDRNGRRRFVAASYRAFWRQYARMLRAKGNAHFYEVIRERTAAKLYLDLEFLREFNEAADGEAMTRAVIEECLKVAAVGGAACESLDEAQDCAGDVMVLDSTTDTKFSRHVVFQKVAFHDNLQMGDFMRGVVDNISQRDDGLMLVRKEDKALVPFVDMGVYTRNRCFRLAGSCKFGKVVTLAMTAATPGGALGRRGIAGSRGCEEETACLSRDEFERSLVCNVHAEMILLGHASRRGDNILDVGRPTCTTVGVKRVRTRDGNGYTAESGMHGDGASTLARLDAYVLSVIGAHGGDIHGATMLAGSETVVYTLKGGYKYCANVGRHHKSNNVTLLADLRLRAMYQRCFDPDCRGFRSAAWALPEEVFAAQGGRAEEEVDDEALGGLMDELEGRAWCDDGVDDEAMVKAMDDAMMRHQD